MPDAESTASLDSSLSIHQHKIVKIGTILATLDALVFLELSILYYLDNSTALLLIRAIAQISFVSPRPDSLPANTQSAPIAVSTLVCLITHIFAGSPPASDGSSYGYLHGGGTLVDFVGQRPVSRISLIFLDLLVAAVQLISVAVTFEQQKLKGKEHNHTAQDLDSEEQGVFQDGQADEDGIELQDLPEVSNGDNTRPHPLDHFYGADYMAIKLDIVKSLRDLTRSPAYSAANMDEDGAVGTVLSSIMARTVHRP